MKRALFAVTAIFLLIAFFSCSDSIFEPDNGTLNDITIKSLKSGGFLKKGEGVTFSVISPGSGDIPDKLIVNLQTMAGENVKRLETKAFALNTDLNLDPFDSISTGQYRLEFVIYSGEILITSKSVNFFYLDSEFGIEAVESFPSGIYPGAHVLLRSSLKAPSGSDPFLRWSSGTNLLAKGPKSEGKGKIIWNAPSDEGVYTIRIELFPVAPAGADDYGFKSEIFMDFEVFVSRMQAPSRLKLLPDASYFSLFHLDGNFTDSGAGINKEATNRLEKPRAFPIGSPELITKDDDIGYRIDGTSGFTVPYSMFPVNGGRLEPFTLSMGLDFDDKQSGKTVFSYFSEDNSFNFAISVDSFSNLGARLAIGAQTFDLPAEINVDSIDKRFLLSFSLIPSQAGTYAAWYIDGIRTNGTVINVSLDRDFKATGVSVIGGEGGFSGTIDEIGTYYRDAKGRSTVDPDLYKSAMASRYQTDLILAEAFEGLFIPECARIEGKARMAESGLLFESEAVFKIENTPKNNAPFSVALDFISFKDELGRVEFFWNEAEKPFLTVSSGGKVRSGAKDAARPLSGASKSIRLKFHENDTLVTFIGDKQLKNLPIESPQAEQSVLLIKIINSDPAKPVSLDTITLFAETK